MSTNNKNAIGQILDMVVLFMLLLGLWLIPGEVFRRGCVTKQMNIWPESDYYATRNYSKHNQAEWNNIKFVCFASYIPIAGPGAMLFYTGGLAYGVSELPFDHKPQEN